MHQDLLQGDVFEAEPEELVEHKDRGNNVEKDIREAWDDLKSVVWMEWSERRCPDAPLLLRVPIEAYVDLIDLTDAATISTVVDQVGQSLSLKTLVSG